MEEIRFINFQDSMFFKIEQISEAFAKLGKQFFKEENLGIDHEEFRTLDVINSNPSCCQRDLGKLILRNRTQTSRLLDNLEKKGLINRFNATKGNYLVKKINITEKGQQCYERAIELIKPRIEEFHKNFSFEQQTELKNMLEKLFNAIFETVKIEI